MNWRRSALKLGICSLQFGLTAAIGGCADPMQFAKDGAGEEQLKKDSYVCAQQWERSPKAMALKRDPFGNLYYKATADGRLQECLERKGWRRTNGEDQAEKTDTDTGQNQPRGQIAAEAPATQSTVAKLEPRVETSTSPSTGKNLQPEVDVLAPVITSETVRYGANVPDTPSRGGKLGIISIPVSPVMSDLLKLDEVQGILVTAVYADSVASRAGIKKGDAILKYGNKVVHTNPDLQAAITDTTPGTTVPITIWRGGTKIIVSAKY